MTTKNITGSKEMITLLNRYGHGISYDQVLAIETAIAEKQVESHGGEDLVLPKNVSHNVFSIFCWDNIDLLEETLSGKGTTHCTNGIIVQQRVLGCELPPSFNVIKKSRRRKFIAVPNEVSFTGICSFK